MGNSPPSGGQSRPSSDYWWTLAVQQRYDEPCICTTTDGKGTACEIDDNDRRCQIFARASTRKLSSILKEQHLKSELQSGCRAMEHGNLISPTPADATTGGIKNALARAVKTHRRIVRLN